MISKQQVIGIIANAKNRSAWDKAVTAYAIDLCETIEGDTIPADRDALKVELLNGARNWREYSYGGSALIYDYDIAERVCTQSELARKQGGRLQPNGTETWLDVQARALSQAARRVWLVVLGLTYNQEC